MTNLIKVVYTTGKTITFSVYYDNAGTMTARETNTAMTEQPNGSGLYKGSPTVIVAGDIVIIKEGSVILGAKEYHINIALERANRAPFMIVPHIKNVVTV